MKAKDILINALKRAKEERGLRVIKPNEILSNAHLRKADHNLIVMTDLSRLKHEDWIVIAAYYAMYQSALALSVKVGLESKEHVTTVAILEHFFGKQMSNDLIQRFNELKERKDKLEAITIENKFINYLWKIKQARETVQYGVSISYRETDAIIRNAREFVSKIKLVINELDEKIIGMIDEKINKLKASAVQ